MPTPTGPTPSPLPPPGPAPVLPVESTHKTANEACKKRLQQLGIRPARKIYPPVAAPSQIGEVVDVQTNVFGIEIQKDVVVHQYAVHIKADLSTKKEAVFTKKGRDDFIVLDRHEKCCDIFFHAVHKFSEFFVSPKNFLIYDGQSLLFTTIDLFPNKMLPQFKSVEVDGAEIDNTDLKNLRLIKLEIAATKNPPLVFSATEIGRRTADANMDVNNRVYQQILDLALNQYCIRETKKIACFEKGKVYFREPAAAGFEPYDCVACGDGKTMVPGLKKTVEFIEGPEGRGQNNPAIVIDSLKAAFHDEQTLDRKIEAILCKKIVGVLSPFELLKSEPVIKGLDCYSSYTGRIRHLLIDSIHSLDAETAFFDWKGSNVTVTEYFEKRWDITLSRPKLNLIVCKERGQKNFYPMELLTVTKNQRVRISQQTGRQSQTTTREGAVLPDVRQRLIMIGKNATAIGDGEVLEKLGVSVCASPLQLPARRMPDIKVMFGKKSVDVKNGKWRSADQYTRPAVSPKIWAMYAVGNRNSSFTQEHLNKFLNEFVNMSRSKGIYLPVPADQRLIPAELIEGTLIDAASAKCEFVFIITDDTITHLHQKYKLLERDRRMIVQDMTMSKALSVIQKAKRLTLENVINKTNVKLGGTNYLVADPKSRLADQIIVGIGLSMPPPGSKFLLDGKGILNPVVIGYASNAVNPHEYTGDFLLNTVGQDTLAPIEDILNQQVELYRKSRKQMPKRVIVYRSGVSSNAHGSVIAYEIPIAVATLKSFDESIKLIYIVVTKDHMHRFFRTTRDEGNKKSDTSYSQSSRMSSFDGPKASEMNIPPGILLDSMITHPGAKQFFLNSHTTLQGTARTPCYTVLADDTNASMATLEELTYALCHSHQIVNLTTSVPTPLYVANEYAKRGRNLWIEKTSETPVVRGDIEEAVRLRELTEEMSYKNAGYLIERRVNA